MCCGNNTHPKLSQTRALPGRAAPSSPAAKPGAGARSGIPAPKFVYTGSTGLTVVSPITGKRYRFERPGARAEVDPRDRPWMTFVPELKAV